jgi:HSP20 family protein
MATALRRLEASRRGQPPERWEPFRELERLQDATAQLLENAWSGTAPSDRAWSPFVDIEEADDAWIVEADLPGVDRKDVSVELRDSELSITGEARERERKGILRRRTRPVGRFEYRVTLPGAPDAEGVDAKLADGVLTVRVPKAEQARPQRIAVKGGS